MLLAALLVMSLLPGMIAPVSAEETAAAGTESAELTAAEEDTGTENTEEAGTGDVPLTSSGTERADTAADLTAQGSETVAAVTIEKPQAMTNLVEGWPEMREINEETGLLIDADNDAVLYSLESSVLRYPASTTKILTALLVLENCAPDDQVTMTSTGTRMAVSGSTNAGTQNGEIFTVEQCLYMLILKSANDIANQLAEHEAGSVDAFVDQMNRKAEELGCTNTHFANPSGMPSSEHYTTAEDMARIMKACLANEKFLEIAGTESYTVPPTNMTAESRTYVNHNKLIVKDSEYYYAPCIAGKTGYTDAAWRTYIAAARKDGKTYICVLMRGPDKTDFADAAALFEYGFNEFGRLQISGGSVTVPYGVTEEMLTYEKTGVSSGGTEEVAFYYNHLRVGTARMTDSEYEAYESRMAQLKADGSSDTPEETDAADSTSSVSSKNNKRSIARTVLFIVLIILLVLVILFVLRVLYVRREKKRRAALRRKRRAARRRRDKR